MHRRADPDVTPYIFGSSLFRVANLRERLKRQDSHKETKNAKNGENGRHRKPVSFLVSCLEVEPGSDQQQLLNAEETRNAGKTRLRTMRTNDPWGV